MRQKKALPKKEHKVDKLSIRECAKLIREGELLIDQAFDYHLKNIHKKNKTINALCYVNEIEAKKTVKKLQNEIKSRSKVGRLHGIAFSLKDHIDVAGFPQSDGSITGYNHSAKSNAKLVEILFNEGAYLIGKGNMAEYGKSNYTESARYGRSNNPFNLNRTPGGSGGGDAAAVASGFCHFAIGADAGGSIRVPANFCGLYGMHTTLGAITSAGLSHFPHPINTIFRSNGFLCKHLEDLDLLSSVLYQYDSEDPYSTSFIEYPTPTTKEFAYFSCMNGVEVEGEIKRELKLTVERLKQCGYKATEYTPPQFEASIEPFIILAGQAALQLEDLLAQSEGKPRDLNQETKILKYLRKRLSTELPPLSADRLLLCLATVTKLRLAMAQVFKKYAFILAPVCATVAPPHDTSKFLINDKEYNSEQVFQFARAVNFLGLPAVAFPTGFNKDGLPLGLQIIGERFSDRFLINVIRQISR